MNHDPHALSSVTLQELDSLDPLRHHADEFLPDSGVYLDGNSLGRLPKRAQQRIREVIDVEWGQGLIGSWLVHDWINLPSRVGGRISRLIGAAADEVVVGNSTSVNLFNVAASALLLTERRRIVTDAANFPTDLYVLEGLNRLLGPQLEVVRVPASQIMATIDAKTALVLLSHVDYRTSALLDMGGITAAAQRAGAFMLWDLSHSAGTLPVTLNDHNVDLAVGCTYKYLNGGPGSPAFTFVARRWHERISPVLSGWLGHKAPFDFSPHYAPASGVKRMLAGTPEVLALSALEASVSLFDEVSLADLRAKSIKLSETFIAELERRCAPYGFQVVSPRNPLERGSHISVAHEHGYAIMQALIDRRIIGDFRTPNLMRFGFAPLYQRFRDIAACVDTLEEIMRTRAWDQERFRSRAAVT
ncbi:MAG: kynureninase [Gammaproteobacteria bacterium]